MDSMKLRNISIAIEEQVEKFNNSNLFTTQDSELNKQVQAIVYLVVIINSYIKKISDTYSDKVKTDIFGSITLLSVTILSTFYKHEKFYHSYFSSQELGRTAFLSAFNAPRNELMQKLAKKEEKRLDRYRFLDQLRALKLALMLLFMKLFRKGIL